MHSFKNTFALAALAYMAKANDYYIDPDTVEPATRASWCQSELSTCPLICNQISEGEPRVNTCDPDLLTYGCVCADGSRPNVSEYTLTLPYFTCTEWGNQCVEACGSNNQCANSCREDNPCGAQEPWRPNTTSTATESSAEETDTSDAADAINTNVLGASDNEGAGVALARQWGWTAVMGVMFGAFMMV